VATTSSIVWEGCTPVFVDIHPEYLTIDETKIEAAITPKTSGILATHVFGNPCAIEAIEALAKKHHLKVIYDAAHAFGVTYNNKSVFAYGDVSTCSFHATKLFHTGEGGALFCKEEWFDALYYRHNFGHLDTYTFKHLGINAKMSELQAAMGLAVFKYIGSLLNARQKITEIYFKAFKNSPTIKVLKIRENTQWNYAYFPIILENEETCLKVINTLEKNNIFPRRYFYPSLNTLIKNEKIACKISESISKKIICLPLYHDLQIEDQTTIINIVNAVIYE
jgi:dTDP-4-amino-4,6-dideoxygalactose transaminase